jgi:hypothetical protein
LHTQGPTFDELSGLPAAARDVAMNLPTFDRGLVLVTLKSEKLNQTEWPGAD